MKGAILVILSALLNVQSGGCAPSPPCTLPPFKWCSSLPAAVDCGVRTSAFSNLSNYSALCKCISEKSTSLTREMCQLQLMEEKVDLARV